MRFVSSGSDSEEDEEGVRGPSTPPRPTLRLGHIDSLPFIFPLPLRSPFFGSDRCSMVSIPNSLRVCSLACLLVNSDLILQSAEVGAEVMHQPPVVSVIKRSSLEDKLLEVCGRGLISSVSCVNE